MTDKGVILIVDDILTNLEVLFNCLTDAGFKILVAEDGESAIQNAKYALPNLILLDILMPGIDGFETCRRLKADDATAEIPIIFITALTETVDKVKGFNLGAVDYITKPFQQEEVLARVQTHLRVQQLTQQLREQMVREQAATAESEAARNRATNILESITDAFFAVDRQWRLTYVNRQAERLAQRKREELLGRSLWDEFPEAVNLLFYQEYHRAMSEQVSVEFEAFYPPLNSWIEARAYPSKDGLSVYYRDISDAVAAATQRRRAEEAIRESEQRLQLALQAAKAGSWDLNLETGEVIASNQCKANLGLSPDAELSYRQLTEELIHPDDRAGMQAEVQRAIEQHTVYEAEYRTIWSDGSVHWILARGQIYYREDGTPYRMTGVTLDITERKRTEEALQESEERFHQAFENAAIGMALVSLEGHWLQVNRSLCEMLGYSEQELLATTFKAVTHPDDMEIGVVCLQQMMSGKIDFCQIEKRYLHKLGHPVWVMLSSSMIRDGQEQPLYCVTQIEDISQAKQLEAERKQALEELRNLSKALESAVEGIAQLDTQAYYTQVNPAYASMLGYEPEELIGKKWQQTVYRDDLGTVETAYQRMLIDGKAEVESKGVRKDGTVFDKQVVLVKAYDQQQQFIGSYCFAKDISDRREIERLKDEFISVVSHELRTPLTSISAALDLLAEGVLHSQPEDAQHMLNIAANNTDRLVRLINDILDIERIESGKIVMTKQVCDASELMNQSVEAIQEIAERAGVTLSVSPLSVRLWADPDRIIQVLTNLLSNAIKFSLQGSTIWLSAELIRGQELEELKVERLQVESSKQPSNLQPSNLQPSTPPDTLLIKVRDQGRGIPSDKLESIFERFQQVDASDSRQKGGTGLGLAICRSILQHHDGQIWVQSTLGEGSTFCFTLPILKAVQGSEFVPPNGGFASLTVLSSELGDSTQPTPFVLVCDDDPSVRTVVRAMLERQGYRVLTVASGYEAVEQSVTQPPDVILLNLMMPGMDGWETLAVLKQQTETQAIPVIILSGLLPDAREVPHPDVRDWIVKPPEPKVLRQVLERALTNQNQTIKVLIVEDDLELAQVLATMFSRHRIETFHAQTGREAIQLSQHIIPDLLVLDLALPEYNGFAVVDWLRQHNRLCQVPLVVYTAQDLDESDRERLKLGQTLFLTKGRITSQEFEQGAIDLLNRMIRGKTGDAIKSQNFRTR